MTANHEARNIHIISNCGEAIEVHRFFAKELGCNGLTADAANACMLAPSANDNEIYVYMTTNGDDLLVGWLDDDGDFELCDDAKDWIGATEMSWLRDTLNNEFGCDFSEDVTDNAVE